MTKELREAAQALIDGLEREGCCNVNTKEFKDLKATLKPSRTAVLVGLQSIIDFGYTSSDDDNYMRYAIEYLKENQDG